jgi:GNAT superfamily N-acetyltransferase
MIASVAIEDPACADARALVAELCVVLTQITGASGQASFDMADVRVARACFAIARDPEGRALGCGALRPLDARTAEVKRMFARAGTHGVGSAVLQFLERQAAGWGYAALRLETRRVNVRAVTFYERRGYRRIPNYGRYVGNDAAVCLEKLLAG